MDLEADQALLDKFLAQSYKEKPEKTRFFRQEPSSYENLSARFTNNSKNFNMQYSHIYFTRLCQLRPTLEKKFKTLHLPFCKVIEIRNNETCNAIGTLYKEMKLKPSILKKVNQDQNASIDRFKDYTSPDDFIYLEDETGRAKLQFDEYVADDVENSSNGLSIVDRQYSAQELVTGMICGIKGRCDGLGVVHVQKIYFCDLPNNHNEQVFKQVRDGICKFVINPQKNFTNIHDINYYMDEDSKNQDKFVAFVSGLNYSHYQSQVMISNLKQFLYGDTPNKGLRLLASRIVKVVFAGNMIKEEKELSMSLQGAFKVQEMYAKVFEDMKKNLQHLDSFCSELSQNVTVDVMPGENDPSDDALPQQPLNRAYFPSAYSNGNLNSVSNPYLFNLDDVEILSTSGKNVTDLMQYAHLSESPLDVMEASMHWRHIAPTAPDTLKCHPFEKEDPFVIENLPQVYVVGNQQKFETRLYYNEKKGQVCRLATVPAFSEKGSIVVVNLRNLDCFEINC